MEKEARSVPWEKILIFVLVFIGFFILVLFRSTDKRINVFGIQCGSWQYWLLFFSVVPYFALITYLIARWLNNSHRKKVAVGFEYVTGDVEWNAKNLIFFPIVSIFAGVFSGFLGIGGGLKKKI